MRKIRLVLTFAVILSICICMFAGCSSSPENPDNPNGTLEVVDGEDIGVEYGKVTLANLMGKDAVELLARVSGETQWRSDILSDNKLRADTAEEFNYVKTFNSTYDVRLVFEDGSFQEFTNLDFANAKGTIYLGVSE